MFKSHVSKKATSGALAALALCIGGNLSADLKALDDEALEDVSGQLGLLVDDFKFFGHPDANIQLTFDTSLSDDSGYLDHVSIYGSDSTAACKSNPSFAGCSGLSIGTISDPIKVDVKTDQGISYIELLMPASRDSESGIDADFRVLTNTYNNTGKIDISWVQLRNLKLAGTSMKLWSSGPVAGLNGGQAIGMSVESVLNARFDLSVDFANSRATNHEYEKLPPFSTNDTPRGANAGILRLVGVELSNMRLGLFPLLPVTAGTINRDAGQPGHDVSLCSASTCAPDLYIEMPRLTGSYNSNPTTQLNNFNSNPEFAAARALYATPRASITIDNVYMGADGSGNAAHIGSAEIRDIRIQHLRIETRG